MFDIGLSELLLVGLVALIVLGPDRLPGAVRTAGLWIGRIKRSFSTIKQQVEQELGTDEIRRQLHNEQILQLEREMNAMRQDLIAAGKLAEPTPEPAADQPDSTPADTAAPAAAASVAQAKAPVAVAPTPATNPTAAQVANQDKPQP